MRYFATISYQGTNYSGWQIQPHAPSVQERVEEALSTLLREDIKVVGCGRTDAGVHAKNYVLHFDSEANFENTLYNRSAQNSVSFASLHPDPKGKNLPLTQNSEQPILFRLNKILPPDIVFHKIEPVADQAHARYDANYRAYHYHIGAKKNPFNSETVYHFPFFEKLDRDKMQAAAKLLLEYKAFAPFCKSHSDAKTMFCDLYHSEWHFDEEGRMLYHIAANRFLRGMVRLIVGMCLNVGLGKLKLEQVREAMEQQVLLKKSLSVPAHGLFLVEVRYGGKC